MKHLSQAMLTVWATILLCNVAYAGVSVSLQPAATHTVPDRLLNVYVYIDSAGASFNGYECVIRWNPQVLQFVSVQQDTLFGDHFQWWSPEVGPDSVLISHVIMEGGVTVTGPGALSSITLRALQIGQSPIYFDYVEFYRFGVSVTPVWSHDAIVYVESPNSGAIDVPVAGRCRETVQVVPNPIGDESVIIGSRTTGPGDVFRLFDSGGRLLQARRLGGVAFPMKLASILDIYSLPAGPYFLEIAGGEVPMRGKFIRLRE